MRLAPGRTVHRAAALLAMGLAGPAWAQMPGDQGSLQRLNEDVAYSLFPLTNGGFTSSG